MAQVVVGHFADRDQAAKAAQEIYTRHLAVSQPKIVQHEHEPTGLTELDDLKRDQHEIELVVTWAAVVVFVVATIAMIVIGRGGMLVVALPTLAALLTMGLADALLQVWQAIRREREHRIHVISNDVVVDGVEDSRRVEAVLNESGAEDVEILVA